MAVSKIGVPIPNSIPANLNNIKPELPVPHGSVGFTLYCRSGKDFSTVLAIVYKYASMGYTHEVNGEGAGNVTLNVEDPAFLSSLLPGVTLEMLLERDNLWEVYFDGKRKFQWLGQNVKEVEVGREESRSVAISGLGLADTLTWAKVFPSKFPVFHPKIDTMRDNFTDDSLNTNDLWIHNGGNFAVANNQLRLTVTGTGVPGSHVGTALAFDFQDSGVQVRVNPFLASLSGPGHIVTLLRIEAVTNNTYIAMYAGRDASTGFQRNVLVCEVSNGVGLVSRTMIPYDFVNQEIWRIQEADKVAIFSAKRSDTGINGPWTEVARIPYTFDATAVRVRLQAYAEPGSNLTLPQVSTFSELSVDGVAAVFKPLEIYRRLLLKAQARGTLKFIVPQWTPEADSVGYAWRTSSNVDAAIGADLLSVLNDFCEAAQADWLMGPDFNLIIRQRRIPLTPGPDPEAPFHKEDRVIFYEEQSQQARERERTYRDVKNYLVGKTANDEYMFTKADDSIASFQQREDFISDSSNVRDLSSLRQVLEAHLEKTKNGVSSWTVKVPFDEEGRRLYEDYELGDWIGVQRTFPHGINGWRVMAVSISVQGDGAPDLELTLDNKLRPRWGRLRRLTNDVARQALQAKYKGRLF